MSDNVHDCKIIIIQYKHIYKVVFHVRIMHHFTVHCNEMLKKHKKSTIYIYIYIYLYIYNYLYDIKYCILCCTNNVIYLLSMFMSINVCWEPFKYTGIETVMEIFNIDNIKLLQRQLSRILSIHSLLLTTRGHSLTTWTPAPHGCTSPKTTFPITYCTNVTQLIALITQLIALITNHTADCTDH